MTNDAAVGASNCLYKYTIGYIIELIRRLLKDKDELRELRPSDNTIIKSPKKKNFFIQRFHIISWIKSYDKKYAFADFIAGITLGLTIIPQSIAYASLAGLPSQYGLYAAFMGAFVYVIFGSIKEVSIGPTSLMALLTLQYTFNKPPEFAVMLAFLAGIVQIAMGLLNIGDMIVDLCTEPVISAFTSATALIVFIAQAKNLLGIDLKTKDIASTIIQTISKMGEIRYQDAVLGLICIIFLLSLKQLASINLDKSKKGLKKFLWYISISRNAICVGVSGVVAYVLTKTYSLEQIFKLSADVEPGIPTIALPPFEIQYGNVTYTFVDILAELNIGIVIVPVVGMLANVAIAKVFSTDGNLDASQEMLSLGLCNLMGSLFRGMPTCGAFTRSAVSNSSGIKTPMAGIYSGTMVILALSLLTPYFKYIPKSTLAAVLMCAVLFMIDFKIVPKLFKESKLDFLSWAITFVVCLAVGVEIGLLVGIVISIIFLLKKLSRPKIIAQILKLNNQDYILVSSKSDVFYTAIDYLRVKISLACSSTDYKLPVVVDGSKISQIDYTAIKTFKLLEKEMKNYNVLLILKDANPKLEKLLTKNKIDSIKFCHGSVTEGTLKGSNENDLHIVESH